MNIPKSSIQGFMSGDQWRKVFTEVNTALAKEVVNPESLSNSGDQYSNKNSDGLQLWKALQLINAELGEERFKQTEVVNYGNGMQNKKIYDKLQFIIDNPAP